MVGDVWEEGCAGVRFGCGGGASRRARGIPGGVLDCLGDGGLAEFLACGFFELRLRKRLPGGGDLGGRLPGRPEKWGVRVWTLCESVINQSVRFFCSFSVNQLCSQGHPSGWRRKVEGSWGLPGGFGLLGAADPWHGKAGRAGNGWLRRVRQRGGAVLSGALRSRVGGLA